MKATATKNQDTTTNDSSGSCKWRNRADRHGDDGLFTFEDIERGQRVVHRGNAGWVVDKGEHILPNSSSSHIEIWIGDDDRNNHRLHEEVVNKYLREGRKLWVDWTGMGVPEAVEDKPEDE